MICNFIKNFQAKEKEKQGYEKERISETNW